ncbi:hypothetical protein [Enterococcus faecalis]|uniref:hypothetical protein n=1 Tax=Enterococcus TaxID=1350 RepID=UPI0006911083|nr:hypothetical protein [Enterococcus faecalis]EGO7586669.1 hypothetical protein [Enterococcus faecalis]EGO8241901.1 hypothetical protein [Enterococcus faecalis]EGO8787425.1 hypothetical protein [Enterococcus faecalis]EGO9396729.1 hypothetical protein [Enterococcus faecalis]EIA1375198.1 hypothetical protein [Enterococcus faecalis]
MLLQIDRLIEIEEATDKLVVDFLDGVSVVFAFENGYKVKFNDDRVVVLEKVAGKIKCNPVYTEGSKICQAWLLNDNGKTIRKLI